MSTERPTTADSAPVADDRDPNTAIRVPDPFDPGSGSFVTATDTGIRRRRDTPFPDVVVEIDGSTFVVPHETLPDDRRE